MAETRTMAVTCGVIGRRVEVGVEVSAIAPDLGAGLDPDITTRLALERLDPNTTEDSGGGQKSLQLQDAPTCLCDSTGYSSTAVVDRIRRDGWRGGGYLCCVRVDG